MRRRDFMRLTALGACAAATSSLLKAFDLGGFKVPIPVEAPGGVDVGKVTEGAQKIAKGAGGIGINEERAIGETVAIEIINRGGGIWRSSEAATRVILIGKSLARYSFRPSLDFRFAILDSPVVNGFSAPGGYIYITKGLYDAVADDNQLAGVLAHEICHITRRHALQTISRGQLVSGIVSVAGGASSDFAAFDAGTDRIANTLFTKGFDPDDEYDADKFGALLAYETGYKRDGLKDFLVKLKNDQGESKKAFSTHPPLSSRISKLS